MKAALIVLAVIAIAAIVLEVAGNIVAKKEESRFKAMSPEERRKHQERMYRARHFSAAAPVSRAPDSSGRKEDT